ncbi:MAG: SGNH/GDSL hydrolase family protein, partial [Planctomycetes bacterium]|nr:SGNH/GDSL hydrolase family protein [Planctomycetota bacterium]
MRRILRPLVALAIGTSLALALAEGVVRVVWAKPAAALGADLVDTGLFRRDPDCGWTMAPSTEVRHDLHWGTSVTIRTNGAGFRDVEFDADDDRPLVAVIGDSFAFGYGVENDESFPARLREALPTCHVVNCGQTGYNLAQTRALLERDVARLCPDTVVLSFCMNDIEEQEIPDGRARARVRAPTGVKAWLDDNVRLYSLAKHVANHNKTIGRLCVALGIRDRLAGYEDLDPNLRPFLIDEPEHLRRSWDKTFAELDRIASVCESISAKLLVMLVPARQTVERSSLESTISYVDYDPDAFDLEKAYVRVVDHCRGLGVRVVEAREEFV